MMVTQGPYHLFSLGMLLILSYLASMLLVRMELQSGTSHKKIWNVLLLLFFLSAALLGLLLAVKVNYKLNITWIETATQWHVDLGIGFAFVSFFHLTWHLGYFKKIIQRKGQVPEPVRFTPHLKFSAHQVKVLFMLLGFVSLMAQLVLLREFIKTFHGNELVIGIFLALWMILTSAGAWAGARFKGKIPGPSLLWIVLILSGSPLVIYMLLILLNRYIFLPGYEPGMIVSITYVVLLIGLFTLCSGFLFAYFSRSLKQNRINANFYMLDSLGSMAGGIVFGLILVFLLDNIQVLAFLFLSTVLVVIPTFRHPSRLLHRLLLGISGILLFTWILFPGNRNLLEGLRYHGETILETLDSPYGNLTFTEKDGEVTGYLDRNPVISSSDLARSEELVHYASLQRPAPSSFLLLGGGLSGIASEVVKYNPEKFDYCEADPRIYQVGRKYLPPAQVKDFNFIQMDGRSWLKKAGDERYDVIISTAGNPLTIGWNRYFTREFYQLVKAHLAESGVFCMQLATGGNYVNEPGAELLGINYQTLKKVFKHVTMVPGYATYFLASADPISLDFPLLLSQREVSTTYVHPDYLDVARITFDADQLMERIDPEAVDINSDLWPKLFFASISSLESRMGGHTLLVTGIVSLVIFLLLLFSYEPMKAGMFVAGFTGAGIQILLITVIQSYYGFAYLVAPVLITVFMAGIVGGTLLWRSVLLAPSLAKYTGLIWIMGLAAATGVVLLKVEQLFNLRVLGQLLLGLLNLLPGMIVGAVYGMSLQMRVREGASGIGKLYSADLAGAALGTFIPIVFMLPLIGVTNTFILFCGINVATGLYILTRWQ